VTNNARDISVSALIERSYHHQGAAKSMHMLSFSSHPVCLHLSTLCNFGSLFVPADDSSSLNLEHGWLWQTYSVRCACSLGANFE